MTNIGIVHVTFGVAAIASGAVILFNRKGTTFHRRVGWIYIGSMVGLNATALTIYRLFGHFGPFHALALVSLASVIAAVIPVWTRRPKGRWIQRHYNFVTSSYVGLMAAFAAEITVRVPALHPRTGLMFAALVIGSSLGVALIGTLFIARGSRTTLARFVPKRVITTTPA